MRARLEAVQAVKGKPGWVFCAACGRPLEKEFMQLEHIRPKSDGGVDYITNRILICGPCNMTKSDRITFRQLRKKNKDKGWTMNAKIAMAVFKRVEALHKRVRIELP